MSVKQSIFISTEIVNDEFVTIVAVHFQTGDEVQSGAALADIATSKTVYSVYSEEAGFIEYFCKEGDEVEVGAIIVKIYSDKESIQRPETKTDSRGVGNFSQDRFSKSALKAIEDHKLDKSVFKGKGLIGLDDVMEYLGNRGGLSLPVEVENAKSGKISAVTNNNEEWKKLSKAKSAEIVALSQVQQAGLNSVVNVYVDVNGADELRENPNFILSVAVYETSRLLRKYRELNAYFVNSNIAFYKDINIGLAVDIEDGLKVLRVSKADIKDFLVLEQEVFELISRYLDKSLTSDDIAGSTFTITDLSSHGVSFFTPLINKNQSAILGISGIDVQLKRFVLTLTFDHRVTEGRRASLFLHELKERMESHWRNSRSPIERGLNNNIVCKRCLKSLEEDRMSRGLGLIRIIDHDGKENYICRLCAEGW
ncbi:MAG: 2-oxo acid dehydrogenase subunit E2 [Candidatus Omnitrophota bacterium]